MESYFELLLRVCHASVSHCFPPLTQLLLLDGKKVSLSQFKDSDLNKHMKELNVTNTTKTTELVEIILKYLVFSVLKLNLNACLDRYLVEG